MKKSFIFFYLLLAASLILLDQLAKSFLLKTKLNSGFISFFCNENLSWGIKLPTGFFYFLWVIIIGSILLKLFTDKKSAFTLPLILILSGGISNLVDRLTQGCVIDFINLKIWPVFNLADVYITIGIAMLALKILNKNPRSGTS
ncbi:MAG: signal peptidase II [Parcubacteria group bacterium]|jgi:signal peptidase II